jgi:hypothetical protein
MWGFIKGAVNAVADAVAGAVHTIWSGVKAIIAFVFGLPDFVLALFGIYLPKKIRVEAMILVDEHRQPVAARDEVQEALELANAEYKEQMNVRVIFLSRDPVIIPEIPPPSVLVHSCWPDAFTDTFAEAGRWLRQHAISLPIRSQIGWGSPVTVFVIRNVTGDKNGCSAGMLADYVVIDPDALDTQKGPEGKRLTLAHEVGHACRLVWHQNNTLMRADWHGRPRRLTRLQKALFRSSGHVSYF